MRNDIRRRSRELISCSYRELSFDITLDDAFAYVECASGVCRIPFAVFANIDQLAGIARGQHTLILVDSDLFYSGFGILHDLEKRFAVVLGGGNLHGVAPYARTRSMRAPAWLNFSSIRS